MIKRKILYGYQIQQGKLLIQPEEADVVRRIVTLYARGFSYQKIAEFLNREGIPYSLEVSIWDKHKVKRLLENPRYTGADGYPVIVNEDAFQTVQEQVQKKLQNRNPVQTRPALLVKEILQCTCGSNLCRIAGRNRRQDTLYLKCRQCEKQITILDADLMREISAQMRNHDKNKGTGYQPSSEVIRLANAVNRSLEHPDNPKNVISLILQGISARYDCCSNPTVPEAPDVDEMNFKRFYQVVSDVTISDENVITVHFK